MRVLTRQSKPKLVGFIIFYYILLFWVYCNLIGPRWEYRGLGNEFSYSRTFLSVFGAIMTLIMYVKIDKRKAPSALVMNLFNLLFYLPMYVYVAFKPIVFSFYIFLVLYQFFSYIIYMYVPVKFKPILPRGKYLFYCLVASLLIAGFFISGYYNGFQVKFDLSGVYENRLAVREKTLPSIVGYIRGALYFVGIIALMYALENRKIIIIFSVLLLQFMLFAFGASKTQFFSIFITLIAYFFYSDKYRNWLPISLIIIILASIAEYIFFNTYLVTDIWTRRTLFIPPKISYDMYEFFEMPNRPYLYWRGSVLRFLGLEDPYGNFQYLIGRMNGGTEDTNANTGLLGNDYAQFGWLSILVFAFLRNYILKLYDYCAYGVSKKITVVLSIFIAFKFISGTFFSVLLTGGVLLTCYLLYTYPNKYLKPLNSFEKQIR